MTAPSAFLGLLIASAFGFLFHLVRGGRLVRLGLYLVTAWVGFFIGHFVGEWWDWRMLRLGSLNLFASTLGAALGLIAASILAGPERGRPASPPAPDEDEGF